MEGGGAKVLKHPVYDMNDFAPVFIHKCELYNCMCVYVCVCVCMCVYVCVCMYVCVCK